MRLQDIIGIDSLEGLSQALSSDRLMGLVGSASVPPPTLDFYSM